MTTEEALFKSGIAALQRRDGPRAQADFSRAIALGSPSARVHLGMALACLLNGDMAGAEVAADATLSLEPANIRALIIKGDLVYERQDKKAAAAHYGLAMRIAARIEQELPSVMKHDLSRVGARLQELKGVFQQHLLDQLKQAGYRRTASSDRFNESLDMLLGKYEREDEGKTFPQAPHIYFMPDVPYHTFYPPEELAWMPQVEAATDTIAAELTKVLEHQADQFTPYIHSGLDRPQQSETDLLDSMDWTSAYIWEDGEPVPEIMAHCPETVALMEQLPLTRIKGMAPSVLFSKLDGGARIEPHSGLINTRLICHLPLIVPHGCGLRVGADRRQAVRGTGWAFDDSINHEAWNDSDSVRIILLFDVWRPDLTEDEQRWIKVLLESVSEFQSAT